MTKKMVANRGWLAAIAASTLVAIVGALAFASIAAAAPTISLSADNATPAPGDTVVVSVNVSGTGTNAVGGIVGSVTFDSTMLTATACSAGAGPCNLAPTTGAGTVSVAPFSATALSGAVATVTFTVASGASGAVAVGLDISQCTNDLGDARTDCTATGTTLTVTVATPSPSPSPSASAAASPTATVGAFTNTGGAPSDGSSSALPLVLAALGLVTVGGAAWAVSRMRRTAS